MPATLSANRALLPATRKAIRMAGMAVNETAYIRWTIAATLVAFLLGIPLAVITGVQGWASVWLSLVVPFGTASVTAIGFAAYPKMRAQERKADIEANLWEATSFMAVMAATEMEFPRIVTELAASPQYGVIAKEMSRIQTDMEMLGRDTAAALATAAERSPSPAWQELLLGLIGIVFSGGQLRTFLESKSTEFLDLEKKRTRERIDIFGAIGEGYLVVAVLIPLVMLVVLVSIGGLVPRFSGIMGAVTKPVIYVGLPLINLAFALVVLQSDKHERRSSFHPQEQRLQDRGHVIMMGVGLAAALVTALMAMGGRLGDLPISASDIPLLALITFLAVYGTYATLTMRRGIMMERFYSEFLLGVAEKRHMGMNFPRAVRATSQQHYGPLEPHLARVRNMLDWDFDFDTAIATLAANVKLRPIEKSRRLVEIAHSSGGRIAAILMEAARGIREKLALFEERNRRLSLYTVVVYLGLAVLLFTSRVLIHSFADAEAALPPDALRGLARFAAMTVAIGGSLVAGMMSHRYASQAFPHMVITLLITFLAFKTVI